MTHGKFKKTIWEYYRLHKRKLPWRQTRDPYKILVSEIMLQQTQVSRAEPFYEKFIKRFPDFGSLAKARTADILGSWQGLGYNRRALALQKSAQRVMKEYGGRLPRKRETLESFPGIGRYTAGAIRAFAFGEPEVFIETNIRRVFIHFFFPKRRKVHDEEIMVLIARTLHEDDARSWYYALMDYGAMLGARAGKDGRKNPNRRSAQYAKQSRFFGSDRELRGKLLRLLILRKKASFKELTLIFPEPERRIWKIVTDLTSEGFIKEKNNLLRCS